jgi:hypothetical protein
MYTTGKNKEACSALHVFSLRKAYTYSKVQPNQPKYKEYHIPRPCPVENCPAICKRLSPHLEDVHGIARGSTPFNKMIIKARLEARCLRTRMKVIGTVENCVSETGEQKNDGMMVEEKVDHRTMIGTVENYCDSETSGHENDG